MEIIKEKHLSSNNQEQFYDDESNHLICYKVQMPADGSRLSG